MYIFMYVYICYTYMYIHVYKYVYYHVHIHHICICVYIQTCKCIHTYTRVIINTSQPHVKRKARRLAKILKNIHTHTLSLLLAHTHVHIHTHIHTHTHTPASRTASAELVEVFPTPPFPPTKTNCCRNKPKKNPSGNSHKSAHCHIESGVAMISRLLKIIILICRI